MQFRDANEILRQKIARCEDNIQEPILEEDLSIDDEEIMEERSAYIPSYGFLMNPIKMLTMNYPGAEINNPDQTGHRLLANRPNRLDRQIGCDLLQELRETQGETRFELYELKHHVLEHPTGTRTPRPHNQTDSDRSHTRDLLQYHGEDRTELVTRSRTQLHRDEEHGRYWLCRSIQSISK